MKPLPLDEMDELEKFTIREYKIIHEGLYDKIVDSPIVNRVSSTVYFNR